MYDPGGVLRLQAQRLRRRLSWALVLGPLLVLGINCGGQAPQLSPGSDFAGGVRWAAGDTSRLLRNAHYFKLMGQPELGIKELEEAHRLDPGNLKVADALAQYCDEVGMGARAQQIYLEALALAPDNLALQNNLGYSYYQAGNWSQAETCYRQALTRQPNNQTARNNLGLLLCRQGRQEEARRLWQETETEAVATQKLGEALAALGMAGEPRYAQQTRPYPQGQSSSYNSPPGGRRGADPLIAPAGPLPSQASSPAASREILTATPPAAPPSHQPAPGLVVAKRPARPLPPRIKMAAAPAPRSDPRETAIPASPVKAKPRPVLAGQPDPKGVAGKTSLEKPRANPRAPITVRELMETAIVILNGNGIRNLAHDTRSRLQLEGYNLVAIKNFRDFGANRTVIYYRPDAERVATILNNQFFPQAELEPAPRLANNIDVKVVLGHDLCPQQQAKAPQAHVPRL